MDLSDRLTSKLPTTNRPLAAAAVVRRDTSLCGTICALPGYRHAGASVVKHRGREPCVLVCKTTRARDERDGSRERLGRSGDQVVTAAVSRENVLRMPWIPFDLAA